MTSIRRLLRFALVLAMLIFLFALSATPALADDPVLGKTTADKVNVRVGASSSAKLLFQIPTAGYVGTVKSEKDAEGIHWYRVEFQSPEEGNGRFYTGYVNGEYFDLLTAEEAASYQMGDIVATPTPIPDVDPETGTTPTPTPQPTHQSGSTDAPNGTMGVVTNGGVNLRKGPATSFGVITQLNRGDVVTVLTIPNSISDKTFYFVRFGDTEGFIMSTFLRLPDQDDPVQYTPTPPQTPVPVTPEPTPAGVVGYVITTKGGVNLRQTPGGTVITQVGRHRTFPVLLDPIRKEGYTWYFVQVGDNKGYLRGDCVREVSNPAPEPTATPTPAPTPTPVPTPAQAPTGYVKSTTNGLNLRDKAGNGSMIGRISKDVVMPYYGEPQTISGVRWFRVIHPSVGTCYVHGSFVTLCDVNGNPIGGETTPTPVPGETTPPPTVTQTPEPEQTTPPPTVTPIPTPVPEQPTGYVKTTAGGLNLRKAAGYTDVLGQLNRGVVLPYYGEPTTVKNVKWYRVRDTRYGYGYLHSNYLTPCNEDGTPIISPVPTVTIIPGSDQPEASYSTLRLGSTGNAVRNMTTELINQGYMSGSATDKYTTTVETAVKNFQAAKNLTVDGIAGATTLHALYGTVPIGQGNTGNLSMTLYPAEKIDWFTGGIQELWTKGSNYKVYDVMTGIVWWAHRWAGGNHADVEPLTAADTARLCKIYGVSTASQINSTDHWQRRPCLVTIGTRTFACSLYGVPHNPDGDTIANNNMTGQVCIHFTNSKTHDSKRVDSGHQQAIEYAWLNAPNGHK